MLRITLIIINAIALLCAIIWSIQSNYEWEPIITSLGLTVALIGQIFAKSKQDKKTNMKQEVKNNSVGIQAGGNVNVKGDINNK